MYFVKYIQAMQADGITIDGIIIQNETLYPGNNPSMYMTAADQALFIKQSQGPAFAAAGITTKIIVYDHNADRTDYPLSILNDPGAREYVDGSAFHLYGGTINALTAVHDAYPDKNLYFTEQWVGAPGNIPNVAFRTPDGKKVLIVINTAPAKKNFNVKFRGNTVQLSLESGAAATYIW